jgi:hypothetical protein
MIIEPSPEKLRANLKCGGPPSTSFAENALSREVTAVYTLPSSQVLASA